MYGEVDGIPGVEPAYGMPVTWIDTGAQGARAGPGLPGGGSAERDRDARVEGAARVLAGAVDATTTCAALMERLNALAPKLAGALDKALTPHAAAEGDPRAAGRGRVAEGHPVPIATTLARDTSETTKDPILLAAEVRCALKRQIVSQLYGQQGALGALGLQPRRRAGEPCCSDALNQARRAARKVALDSYPVDPHLLSQLQATHAGGAGPDEAARRRRRLLLVMPQVRPLLARYARLFAPGLAVLSYNEVPDQKEIAAVGTLG